MNQHWVLFILTYVAIHVVGQQRKQQSIPKGPRSINLFVINDENNDVANRSVGNSLKNIRDKHPEWLGNVLIVKINGAEPHEALEKICSTWDKAVRNGGPNVPDLLLDMTRSGFGAETVNSFTSAVGIPTLSTQFGQIDDLRHWRDLTDDKKLYLIQVMQPADLIPDAIRQLSIQMNISNAAIIFDDNFIMDHKYKSLLVNVPTRHVIVKSKNTKKQIDEQLTRIRSLDLVNFFILSNDKVLTSILDDAEAKNFTNKKYGWYGFSLDDVDPKCDCKNITILFFKPKITTLNQQRISELTTKGSLPKPILTSAFYYDLTKLGVLAMRLSTEDGSWPYEPPHITCNEYNGNNTPIRNFDFLKQLNKTMTNNDFQPTFASFYWGRKNGQHHAKFDMKVSLIVIDNGNTISTDELGTWEAGIDSPLKLSGINNEKVSNHTAVTSFRIVTVETPPFIMYNKEKDEWSGYCIDLIEEIRKILGFEYEIRLVDDNNFGSMNDDGEWNGMIKELVDKKADIALGALSVMAERENVVDFTVPYYDLVGLSILMKKPKAETSLFKFLTVLENDVWLCILGSYFFTSILMWLFDKMSPYSYQNNKDKYKDDDEKREFTLKESLWFCMTSLTPQGGGEAPKNLSGRLVAATWWLFGFIIIASYTANLAAFLTVSRLESPIESLDDLSKQYKVTYAPIKPSEAYTYFERMSNIESRFYEIWKDMSLNDSLSDIERAKLAVWDYPVSDKYTKMFQAMADAGFPSTMEEALARIMKLNTSSSDSEFALIGDGTDIRYLEMTTCNYIMVGEEFSRKPYAIAVQQGSPLKDQFNNAILQLLNKRQLEQLKAKWWQNNKKKMSCEQQDDQSDGISLANIGGVFIVIFVGIGMACVTLGLEYWWYRCYIGKNRRNKSIERKRLPPPSQIIKPMRFESKKNKLLFKAAPSVRSRF
ncbi:hypothetical protein HCN44_009701 [Aphidius gifuensis]|uniref:Ionotropic receptor n=1 Tax=Aphidius gifuensis TaxID=684658 RepID=A0A834Y707_APHGI|nr:hypothetical protein HCN44_009701 [Aphidius gifuensis]